MTVLAVIATFTIPKVLQSQQYQRYNAIAKEAASSFAAAYQIYALNNPITASTSINDITPYLNYVQTQTIGKVDHKPNYTFGDCSAVTCLKLHNGAVVWYNASSGHAIFGGTASTNAVLFLVDPNGTYSGSTNSSDKAVEFALYTNGSITSRANFRSNTTTQAGVTSANANDESSWFSWN